MEHFAVSISAKSSASDRPPSGRKLESEFRLLLASSDDVDGISLWHCAVFLVASNDFRVAFGISCGVAVKQMKSAGDVAIFVLFFFLANCLASGLLRF